MSEETDFHFNEGFTVGDKEKEHFKEKGFILVRNLLDHEEVNKLREAIENDTDGLLKHTYGRDDGAGRKTKTVLWNFPGNDITGVTARSDKVAGTMEKLLGSEIYHYHAKVIMKEAYTGGAHIWHQDYGYWYLNGCLYPDMGTVWIAIDQANQTNGCLKILPGSNKAGRIEHIHIGDQMGADTERVDQLMTACPLKHAEMNPGDALFFHSNLLHRSDQNSSPSRRWAFLIAFNTAFNDPVYEHHHPGYTPLVKVPNSAIKSCTTKLDPDEKGFFGGPKVDVSLQKCDEAKAKE